MVKNIILGHVFTCKLLLIFVVSTKAQTSNIFNSPAQIVTPSSQAVTGLGTFGESNVNHNTGELMLSIPLWELKENNFDMPITLDYSSGGVRHNQRASWVGLSWNIKAGGAITRNIVGAPDENENGYWNFEERLKNPWNPGHILGEIDKTDSLIIANYRGANFLPLPPNEDSLRVDSRPDIYSFNFNGFSGEFIILKGGGGNIIYDANGVPNVVNPANPNAYKIILLSKQDIKIEMNGILESFLITTPDGGKYTFDLKTAVREGNLNPNMTYTGYNPSTLNGPSLESKTRINYATWYLTNILLANGEEIDIEYNYDGEYVADQTQYSNLKLDTLHDVFGNIDGNVKFHHDLLPLPDPNDISEHWQYSKTNSFATSKFKRISKIITPNQTIEFVATPSTIDENTTSRKDICHWISTNCGLDKDARLESIVIKNNFGETIRKWNFEYEYFQHYSWYCNNLAYLKPHRLKLTKLIQIGSDNIAMKPYEFEYEESNTIKCTFPGKDGYDYWGYYNGKDNSGKFDIPSFDLFIDTKRYSKEGNDRSPDSDVANNFPYLTAYSLKRIKYPLGGYTDYEFESNDYGYVLDHEVNEKNSQSQKIIVNASANGIVQSQSFTILETQRVQLRAKLASRIHSVTVPIPPNGSGTYTTPYPTLNAPGDPAQYFCHGLSYLYPDVFSVERHKFGPFSAVSKQYPYTFGSASKYQWLNSFGPSSEPADILQAYDSNPQGCIPSLFSPPANFTGAGPVARPAGYVRIEKEITPNVYTTIYSFEAGHFENCYINSYGDFMYMGDIGQDLEPGNYRVLVYYPSGGNNSGFGSSELVYHVGTPSKKCIGGGLRIKSISDHDGFNGGTKKMYTYNKTSEVGRSSGHLTSNINFVNYYQIPAVKSGTFPIWQWNFATSQYDLIYSFADFDILNFISIDVSSHTKLPAGVSLGPNVEYEEVQESLIPLNGGTSNGLTNYKFYTYSDPGCNDEVGLISATSNYFKRGKIKQKSIYDDAMQIKQKTEYTYSNLIANQNTDEYVLCYAGQSIGHHCFDDMFAALAGSTPAFARINLEPYKIKSSFWALNSQEVTDYTLGSEITKLTTYYRDNLNHLQVNRIITTTSKGEIEKLYNYFPLDYPNVNNAGMDLSIFAINAMKQNNFKMFPIEQIKTLTIPQNTEKVTGATLNLFLQNNINPTRIFKKSTEEVKISQPYPLANHSLSTQSNLTFLKDARYRKNYQANLFALNGNPIIEEFYKDKKPAVYSSIYGYGQTEKIAVVSNAENTEIAHTSFESSEMGGCIYSPLFVTSPIPNDAFTGKNVFQIVGNNTVQVPVNASVGKKMIFTIWRKAGAGGIIVNYNGGNLVSSIFTQINGWEFHEYRFVSNGGNLVISGSGSTIDELRLYPENSRMITYTYKPLLGITSLCDENNKTSYYEYNNFNELKVVRDEYKNIKSKIEHAIQEID